MKQKQDNLEKMRHSAAHIMAAAVSLLFKDVKLGIGPVIENGFYYDFDLKEALSPEDFEKIEKKMNELIKQNVGFVKSSLPTDEAAKKLEVIKQPYKIELVKELSQKGEKEVSFYQSGDFVDLCAGPHVSNSKEIGPFKLLSVAGAYWRGSEKNPQMQRIYATAWNTQEKLESYLNQLEEAKKRDHKKLGPALELFMFHETSPGMPYWLPKGVILYNELINFWREEHRKRGYQEIVSPLLNKKELYITSGHYEHYWKDMFVASTDEGETYGIKAMNCPNAMNVFAYKTRSYKDLPLRLSDTDTLHRNELSGTLNGLFRVREFRQDDAHCFVTEDQIEGEYQEIFKIVERFYSIFGMEYSFRLGTRPESFMGDAKTWSKAEEALKKILEESKKDYFIAQGDGAFYGPKIDILMKDVIGREWQMGTIQLDFQMPKRFNLEYVDADGSRKTPIAVHRVIYGSVERFIGILIEHYAGALPVWLSPQQVMIVPIADRHVDFATNLASSLNEKGFRVESDNRSESMQAKIRDGVMQKIPYMAIVGDKEVAQKGVALRCRDGKNLPMMSTEEFERLLEKDIRSLA